MIRSVFAHGLLFGVLILAFSGCTSVAATAQQPEGRASSVFVVRHAEKADLSDPDTPISPSGEARAQALAKVLAERRLVAAFATEFLRTQQTAAPSAKAAGLQVDVVTNAERDVLLERTRVAVKDGDVLIVGHSNTVPAIVHDLSGEQVEGINENEFDNLYEVVFEADGRKRLVRSKYGEPSR